MDAIFQDKAKVIVSWVQEDYQGDLAYAYEFPDGTVVLMTDSFGSCSGCDSWEYATDEEAKAMIQQLAINSRVFANRVNAQEFLDSAAGNPEHFHMSAAKNLNLLGKKTAESDEAT